MHLIYTYHRDIFAFLIVDVPIFSSSHYQYHQYHHYYCHCHLNIWDAIKKFIITYCCWNDCLVQFILGIMMFLLLVLLLLLPPLLFIKNFYHYVNLLKLTLTLLSLVEVFIWILFWGWFFMLLQPLFIIFSYQSSNFSSCLK